MRRTQQDAVYTAERLITVGRTFESFEAVQEVLDDLREEPWWPEHIARVEVGPADRRGTMDAVARWDADKNAGRIEFKPVAMNELIMCHELAHIISLAERGTHVHDPWWARRYTELVYRIMGSDAWAALTSSFKMHGVDYG